MVFFPAAAPIPVRKLLQSAFASGDNPGRLGERVPAKLWGRKSGALFHPGSELNTRTYAIPLGRNDNSPCRTCRNVPIDCREGTTDRRRAAQSGNGSCVRQRKAWIGSGRGSLIYLIHIQYIRNKLKSSANIQCEFAPKTSPGQKMNGIRWFGRSKILGCGTAAAQRQPSASDRVHGAKNVLSFRSNP